LIYNIFLKLTFLIKREPLAKATIESTSNTTRVGLQGNALFASIRNAMLAVAFKLPQVKEMAFKTTMQVRK
jgi:hypothetical protein